MRVSRSMRALVFAPVLALAFTVPVQAVVFNLGTFVVDNDANVGDIPLTVPDGTYNHFSFSTAWTAISGNPYSSEAIWALTDGPLASAATTFYIDQGSAPNSAGSGSAVTLQWDAYMNFPLTGSLDGFILTLQTYAGSTAQWANTTMELTYQAPPTPPVVVVDLGVIGTNTDPININTLAADFDTELALYSSTGFPVAANDDVSYPEIVQSEIDFDSLPVGDYYIALCGYNSAFGVDFAVAAGSEAGNYGLTVDGIPVNGTLADGQIAWVGFTIVPEPATLALFVLGGLAVLRRR
ncbi:MAG: PEP-CTERM sorting domain-containing protein [Phycisphaerae bacterium]|nr:PEP-CTERM sorting domain-containing protein [Phycisphaerae bacterium]